MKAKLLLLACILHTVVSGKTLADTLFARQLGLPASGVSQRFTQRPGIWVGKTHVLFDQDGPGCILHWWLTCNNGQNPETKTDWAHQLRLRFFYDGSDKPSVDMTLAQFFMIIQGRDLYSVNNAAIKVLPKMPSTVICPSLSRNSGSNWRTADHGECKSGSWPTGKSILQTPS